MTRLAALPGLALTLALALALTLALALALTLAAAPAAALPARSALPAKAGLLREGEPLPWLSGWSLRGGASNLQEVMRRGRRGYVVLLSATRCALCEDGMRLLLSNQDSLARQGVQLVLLFSEDITPRALTAWLVERGVWGGQESPSWERKGPVVLIDRHMSFLQRAKLIDISGRPILPYALVLDRAGVVTEIISQEGYDLVDVILSALSGA